MLDKLIKIDEDLLLWINGHHNNFFDGFMFWMSNKYIWIPLYLFFLFLYIKFYKKQSLILILGLIVVVAISDIISVHAFKNVFERLRPCNQEHLANLIHLVKDKCGGKFGFYSSHASNHFAVAIFVSKSLNKYIPWISIPLILWALIISYSRVYLGVHFPSDILAGGIAGSTIALTGFAIIQKRKF